MRMVFRLTLHSNSGLSATRTSDRKKTPPSNRKCGRGALGSPSERIGGPHRTASRPHSHSSVTCRGEVQSYRDTSHAVPSLSASRLLFARCPLLLTRGL